MSIFSKPHILNSARWNNMRIGILGGSFNPAHSGHIHISNIALKTLKLDAIWWLITPQNPLKANDALLPMTKRMEIAHKTLNHHPKILVTDMESQLNTQYSYDFIKKLNIYYSNTHFAWITGMDNSQNFHLWKEWHRILNEICMVHIARQPNSQFIKNCPARMLSSQKHVILNHRNINVELASNITYWILNNKRINISSTNIRDNSHLKTNT